jgi:NAD(P)-dependent dehydrogenase (short-subunit alcohol dehydrogenase family)
MGVLDNKRCLITGGSRGLGRAIACAFARQGARIAFTYRRNEQDAAEALTAISAASPIGAAARSFVGSVSDSAHVREVVETLGRDWGGVDILVNNAGLTQIVPIALLDESDWDEMMDTHVKGAYLFSRAVLKSMIRARAGQILNIGSFASERVIESPVHYAAAKSALRGFTEALAREVGRYGIRVNLLAPGLLDVGLGRMLLPHRIQEYVGQSALGRTGTAAELAEFALFLCSDDSSFMSGAKVVVDGGV